MSGTGVRGVYVGTVGAIVILLSVAALIEHSQREGPIEATLEPVAVDVRASGGYHARPANEPVLGLCHQPPCEPYTRIDVRIHGLPPGDYQARLEGASTERLGSLVPAGDAFRVAWDREQSDQTDKERLVLSLAGRDVAQFRLRPSAEPIQVDETVAASWHAAPAQVRLTEIGGVTISTVAKGRVAETPPAGWEFHAHLEGQGGRVLLGTLDVVDGEAVLDARVERVPLEDQDRIVVVLRPVGSAGPGFPVLAARL